MTVQAQALPAPPFRRSAQSRKPARDTRELYITWALFGLMLGYGGVLRVVGELRYIEIVICAIGVFKIFDAWRALQTNEKVMVLLLVLSACAQAVSDIYNDSALDASAKRVSTYLILALLVIAINWITLDKLNRLRAMILGFAVSYFIIYATAGVAGMGGALVEIYEVEPWRLGLGYAVTLIVCLIPTFFRGMRYLSPALLVILAGVHVSQGGRSMAITTSVTAVIMLFAVTWGRNRPTRPNAARKFMMLVLGISALMALLQTATFMTNNRMMPSEELQRRMEQQLSSQYGLLAAARPDTIAAMYAITKRPIMGYGSSGYDYDVYRFYSFVALSSSFGTESYDGLLQNQMNKEWTIAMPSHSHLFGIWVDAGVMGIFSWLAVLWLSFSVVVQASYFRSRWAAIFIFLAISNMWDVLFSPGPIRIDMALRIVTLLTALRMMNGIGPKIEVRNWLGPKTAAPMRRQAVANPA